MASLVQEPSDSRHAFFQQLHEQAALESLTHISEVELMKCGESIWSWAERLQPAERAVRVVQYAGGCLLEVSSPDMPFLVDSLLAECAAQSLSVTALLHPIVVMADGEKRSIIQIFLPQLDEHEGAAIDLGARRTLDDIAAAVRDHHAMQARMRAEAEKLSELTHLSEDQRNEAIELLRWLASERFVFLGARAYTFQIDVNGVVAREEPDIVEGSSLGLLRDETCNVLSRESEPSVITKNAADFLNEPNPLIIAKSSMISRVHRRVAADYIGVKHYDNKNRVVGETRFLGLFTADAYNEPVRAIPFIRRRVEKIIRRAGVNVGGHSASALANLLETWPRDELFQTSTEQLLPMVLGALSLVGRPRTRVFLRRDRFDRFVSAIVFVSRDAYDTALREKIAEALEQACMGKLVSFHPRFSDGPMIQVHFVLVPGKNMQALNAAEIESVIAELARTWDDAFRTAVSISDLDVDDRQSAMCFRGAFNAAYREAFSPKEALRDVSELAELHKDHIVRLRAYRRPGDDDDKIRAKIYARGASIPLSSCVPVFENMGLFVAFETGFPVMPDSKPAPDAPSTYWIHDLSMRTADGKPIDLEKISDSFADTFVSVWTGETENDGFNQLVLTAGATWREAALLRMLCAYRSQTGRDPTRQVQIRAVNGHVAVSKLLLNLFATKFDPTRESDLETRRNRAEEVCAQINTALGDVAALDEDRALRRLVNLIMAVQRTNFYQDGQNGSQKGSIAVKIASQELEHLPDPKPFREIFTSSPRVDGVHCRFGPIARGGLRWSDRRDDFRTEVLGLVKAQQVKNAVIVPVGSKGGFFPKQLPIDGSRDDRQMAGIAAYKEFISSLLSLTDNLSGGEVVHPEDTVIWDGEDPYLVVAADKGTATFSDIANEISVSRGFWLGDAFASGGSAGYDHKKMGITARGAWEAVKRHFREMGKDIQKEPFTVIGVGDMSGDVFGNGMLLSKQIRLQAAFNHLHIFIDPNPQDDAGSWAERKRLFDLPRSSWQDYDSSLISKGGGVFDRAAKSISLSEEVKILTGLSRDSVTPDELLQALLSSDCELLWFGGIGTYIKAEHETHGDVGDRANDALRVDGRQVRAKVIGEGANLGVTQAGRIEFAMAGGRINTDAIDNSAGVDSSDHEVNIKILCAEAIRQGDLQADARNALLESMTEDVGLHVLRHNYDQTGALSLAQSTADEDHEALERLMVWLEQFGVLDRSVENLPTSEQMRERAVAGSPLTRPELSVLLAWSKIVLFDEIVASELPADPYFSETLKDYFPKGIHSYAEARSNHRLDGEIIATVVANRLLDVGGPAFLMRLREMTNAGGADIAKAFEISYAVLETEDIINEINALDNLTSVKLQTAMRSEVAYALMRGTRTAIADDRAVSEQLEQIKPAFAEYRNTLLQTTMPWMQDRISARADGFEAKGAPPDLARRAASLRSLALGPNVLFIARDTRRSVEDAARVFFTLGDALGIDRLRTTAEVSLADADFWGRQATRRLMVSLIEKQSAAAATALEAFSDLPGERAALAWLDQRNSLLQSLADELAAIDSQHGWSFAKFSLAADSAIAVLES